MLFNICNRYERMRCSRIEQHNCKSVINETHTNDSINMVDSPMGIVLLSRNRNRVGSTGRHRCRLLRRVSAWIGVLVGIMTLLTTGIALSL
jgi:hypothetical protein